jgi:hypothetical protein
MLYCLTFTRPVADILIGIMTIRQNGMHLSTTTTLNRGILIRKISNGGIEVNVMIKRFSYLPMRY